MGASNPEALVIFGASGFVGRNMVEAYCDLVPTVIGVTASGNAVPGCDLVVPVGSLNDIPVLPARTVAVNVAAFRYDAGRQEMVQNDILANNVALTNGFFGFCAQRKIKEARIASSVAVYPAELDVLDDEVAIDLNRPPFAGETFYAWSKRWAEQLSQLYKAQYGINTVAFRLSNPYGPHDSVTLTKAHVAPAFVMKALNEAPEFEIRGDPQVTRDFVYVGDVVRAFRETFEWKDRNDFFNLCSGTTTSLQTLAESALRISGNDKPIRSGAPGAFGPNKRVSTNDKIRSAMNIEFTSLSEGLTKTIEWYRDALAL
ncbi:hypothetical protein GCM10011316_39770 [Roseibium aquae]|uniref:NAD-dependent epimerase/dehydratase domain-containing protein n=1 Tax=Roseibium aquae TaxID=1323746 RepID=A0A916TN77_9HYPH|nr:NAD(P)-dependent oxidoreductase [Roseibium aquae]GGB64002.1 hypothetical protein GCM10011316_39770 [Roseibium aquae]